MYILFIQSFIETVKRNIFPYFIKAKRVLTNNDALLILKLQCYKELYHVCRNSRLCELMTPMCRQGANT